MRRILFVILVLFSTCSLWAETTDSQVVSVTSTDDSKVTGLLEFSFPTSSVDTKFDSGFGTNAQAKKSSQFSLGFGVGGQADNNRGYIIMSFEKLGSFTVNGKEKNLLNVGFKLAYDRTFKPWITDFYLSGGLTYYPKQGDHITVNSKDFAPKDSFGLEVSVGWISPINVAFNFGYKATSKEYAYENINPNNSRPIDEHASISSGWAFVTASIGRY